MEPLARLEAVVEGLGSVLVAFSGGTDSAVVLAVARRTLGDRAVALTAVGPALADEELAEAKRIARALDVRHVLEPSGEISDPAYARNGPDRCYHCKSELYRITARVQRALGLAHTANGTNLDDLDDYRPGLEAAAEAAVRSPLAEAGLRKADVRAVARELGLDVWDKPAAACLASRIPYGTEVTAERLGQVAAFEAALRRFGLRRVRVRHHGELARIEVDRGELGAAVATHDAIVAAGRAAGFVYVTLDLAGYRVGSHNEVLRLPRVDR